MVLLCGLALAVIVAIFEFCWNSRRNADFNTVSIIFVVFLGLGANFVFNFSAFGGNAAPIFVRRDDGRAVLRVALPRLSPKTSSQAAVLQVHS